MMYIENIFICISIPLFLSLIFIRGDMRKYMLFICIGMGMCVLSAYVSSFFMVYYHTDAVVAAIEIVPVCEEVMKLLPLLFYLLIFEPERKGIPGAAVAIAVGFATFENVCYLTENGAADFDILLVPSDLPLIHSLPPSSFFFLQMIHICKSYLYKDI